MNRRFIIRNVVDRRFLIFEVFSKKEELAHNSKDGYNDLQDVVHEDSPILQIDWQARECFGRPTRQALSKPPIRDGFFYDFISRWIT